MGLALSCYGIERVDMQNRPLENTVFVLAAGFFGVFLRWLQLQLAFDDKGLCGPSIFNYIVPLFIIIAAWVLRSRIKKLLGGELILPADYHETLANPGRFYAFLRWLLGLMMAGGGALLIRGSEVEKHTLMLRLIGGAAIATGLAFPLYLGWANRKLKRFSRELICLFGLLPIALFGIWLVYDYVNNAINSVIWGFLVEVLAVSVLMLAFFRLAGYAYGTAEPKKALFWIQFGIFMSLTVLADSRRTGMQVIFLSAGLMLTLADFILLKKLREKPEEKPPEGEDAPLPNGGIEEL